MSQSSYTYTATKTLVNSDWTIIFWIKDFDDDTHSVFKTPLVAGGNSLKIDMNYLEGGSGLTQFDFITPSLTRSRQVSLDPTDGSWHCIAFTYDDSASEIQVYLNGVASGAVVSISDVDFTETSINFGDVDADRLQLETGLDLLLEDGTPLELEGDNSVTFDGADLRVYSKMITAGALLFYYNDMVNNKGDAVMRYGNA